MIVATENEIHIYGDLVDVMTDLTFIVRGIAEKLDNDDKCDDEADVREWIELAVATGMNMYFEEASEFRKRIFDELFNRLTEQNDEVEGDA